MRYKLINYKKIKLNGKDKIKIYVDSLEEYEKLYNDDKNLEFLRKNVKNISGMRIYLKDFKPIDLKKYLFLDKSGVLVDIVSKGRIC